ncbi:MAG: PAS domain-containing sensor histidine kinase, partial [Sphingobacteriales bacterium]
MELMQSEVDLIRQICADHPDSMVWVTPVRAGDETGRTVIVDFEFQYCNAASETVSRRPPAYMVGKRVLQHQLPDPGAAELIFRQCLEVYEKGEALSYTYYSTELQKHLKLYRTKVHDGVLTMARNWTAEYQIAREKDRQARLLENLVDNSPYGISLYESIRNEDEVIVDFRLRIANKRCSEITGLTMEQLYGNTVVELMQLRGHSGYFDICKEVVQTGNSRNLEYYSPARDQWMEFSIVKFEDGYLLNYIDITGTKRLEQQLSHHATELTAIFNGSLSGIYLAEVVKGADGKIRDLIFLRVNDTFLRMFSMTEAGIVGKSLLSISGPDSQEDFLGFVQHVLDSGAPGVHLLKYRHPERWFEFSIVRIDNAVVTVTINDITRQKQAASKIEEQKKLLDSILKHSPNGLAITEAIRNEAGDMVDARTVLMNDACERYNGIPKEVMLNSTYAALSPELLASPLFKAAAVLQPGESFRTEYSLPQTGKWIELAIAKMERDQFINVFTDITPVKEAQVQLERLVEELRRSNESLESFAFAASHDLKEPIRKVRLFADQIRSRAGGEFDEKAQASFARLDLATKRMQQLVDDLLVYAQVQQGAQELSEVDLNTVMAGVLIDLEVAIEEAGATLHFGSLPTVMGNQRQLQQMLQNLVANGVKYCRPEVAPEIWISWAVVAAKDVEGIPQSLQSAASYYKLDVRDNGIGFDQEN